MTGSYSNGFAWGMTRKNATKSCTRSDKSLPIKLAQQHDFSWFPKLPVELRFLIWRQALPGPRIIEFYDTFWDEFAPAVTRNSTTPLLPFLKTCRESQRAVCDSYRKVDVRKFLFHGMGDHPDAVFFINYKTDAILFRTRFRSAEFILGFSEFAERLAVQTIILMLEPLVMKVFVDGLSDLPMCISELENLRKVVLAARVPISMTDPNRTALLDYGQVYVDEYPTFHGVPHPQQRVQGVIRQLLAPRVQNHLPLVDIVVTDLIVKS